MTTKYAIYDKVTGEYLTKAKGKNPAKWIWGNDLFDTSEYVKVGGDIPVLLDSRVEARNHIKQLVELFSKEQDIDFVIVPMKEAVCYLVKDPPEFNW